MLKLVKQVHRNDLSIRYTSLELVDLKTTESQLKKILNIVIRRPGLRIIDFEEIKLPVLNISKF